jgi:uncharacterized protein
VSREGDTGDPQRNEQAYHFGRRYKISLRIGRGAFRGGERLEALSKLEMLDLSACSFIVSILSTERTILRYKIRDIPPEGWAVELLLSESLFVAALEGISVDLPACHGTLRVEISKDERDVLFVRGRLRGQLGLTCARCLGKAVIPLDVPVHMTYTAESENREESDDSLDPLDDVDYGLHDGEILDLEPAVREMLILAVPISPLCHEGCAGLCPVCGANRNDDRERQCGHRDEQKIEDPRFKVLQNLKLDT